MILMHGFETSDDCLELCLRCRFIIFLSLIVKGSPLRLPLPWFLARILIQIKIADIWQPWHP